MKQLHITLNDDSSAIKWAHSQADKLGARGHVGTHLDCYTTTPAKDKYSILAHIINCTEGMPTPSDMAKLPSLKDSALLLHTGNLEQNGYGTDNYFKGVTFLSEETLTTILEKQPLFIIIDSHGIAEKGKKHITFDKRCEANGCHVIENVDLSVLGEERVIEIAINIDINHHSTGKPCEVYWLE